MRNEQLKNLFEQAMLQNEILEFAIGKSPYFVLDKEYDTHSVIGSWQMHIRPFLENSPHEYSQKLINEMFEVLTLAVHADFQNKGDLLVNHVNVLQYYNREGISSVRIFKRNWEIFIKTFDEYLKFLQIKNESKFHLIENLTDRLKANNLFEN